MPADFDKYAATGNEMLNLIAEELHIPKNKAYRMLRAVLHAIREYISVQESVQVIARLPMALKALYVDQWALSDVPPRLHGVDQFLNEVRVCDNGLAGYVFGNDETAAKAVKTVFRTLNYYISNAEFEDIVAVLPADIKSFVANSIRQKHITQ